MKEHAKRVEMDGPLIKDNANVAQAQRASMTKSMISASSALTSMEKEPIHAMQKNCSLAYQINIISIKAYATNQMN